MKTRSGYRVETHILDGSIPENRLFPGARMSQWFSSKKAARKYAEELEAMLSQRSVQFTMSIWDKS